MEECADVMSVFGRSPVCGAWCMPRFTQSTLYSVLSAFALRAQMAKTLQIFLIQTLTIQEFGEVNKWISNIEVVVTIRGTWLGVFLLGDEEV
jgi:hypothetical protein